MSDLYRGRAQVNGYRDLDTSARSRAPRRPWWWATRVPTGGKSRRAISARASITARCGRSAVRWPNDWRPGCRQRRACRVEARRELGRSLVAQVLEERARQRARAGEPAVDAAEEYALAEAVMAALFGLGRLQPLVDDPLIENIEVNGCDRVWLSYADGREEPGPPVADSDAELIELLQLLAARLGSGERSFTSDVTRCSMTAWRTARGWRPPRG